MMDMTGQTIGNYRIESLLGTGGMGQVFRATHVHLNRPAAIKVLHAQYASDPSFQARFQQEARAAAALKHPNIIEILDFGEADGRFYLVMELVTDGSVRTLLQQQGGTGRPLSLSQGIDLVRQAAEGLAYAHSQQMVHRDIKPDNLLVSRIAVPTGVGAYTVKITDFGLARLAEGGVATAHGVTMGTPAYMSPEQCQAIDLDGRSDIYSLGVVLYEVTTGYLPFDTKSLSDAVYKHVYSEPPPPRQVRTDLPPALEEVILRCLKKPPADRYPNGTELAAALQQILNGLAPEPAQSHATAMGRPQGIRALLDQEVYTLAPGQPTRIRVTLANLGDTPEQVDLVVDGIPAAWLTLPPLPIVVQPGAPQTANIQVLAPRDASVRAGDLSVNLQARSRANASLTASASARVSVEAFAAGSAELKPTVLSGRSGASSSVFLTNSGNTPVTWDLQAIPPAPGVAMSVAEDSPVVEPGATRDVRVNVRAGRRFRGGPIKYPIALQASPRGGQPVSLSGEFTHRVFMPIWLPIAAGVVVLALAGGLTARSIMGTDAAGTPTARANIPTATQGQVVTASPTTAPASSPTAAEVATATTAPVATATSAPVETPTVPAAAVTPTVPVVATPTERILFAANRGDVPRTLEILTISPDGTDERRLTTAPTDDEEPAYSPDGTRIAYVVVDDTGSDIWIMNADGASPKQLTSGPAGDEWPLWSPDGTQIAFSRTLDGNVDIYLMNPDGSNLRALTTNPAGDFTVNWSPDSKQIAFASQRVQDNDIYVVNADGSGDPVALSGAGTSDTLPVWSPDGKKIVYVAQEGDESRLVIMNADGSDKQTIARDVAQQPDTEFSPSGQLIAYVSLLSGNPDIYIVTPDGSVTRRLTDDPGNDTAPAWSPDGKQIAYLASPTGTEGVWIMNFDGTNRKQLTTAPGRHWSPSWSPAPPP